MFIHPSRTGLVTPVALLCLSIVLVAEEPIQPADPMLDHEVGFYRDVLPILQAKCLACHSAAVKESDLVLESVESTLKGGASGPTVVAGKPDESMLYLVVTRHDEPFMPPLPNKAQAKPLTPREVGVFRKWIEQGAPAGDRPLSATDIAWQPVPETYKATYSLAVSPNHQYVAAGRGNRIFMYDIVRGVEVGRLTDPALLAIQVNGHPLYGPGVAERDFVHCLTFSANGRYLASGGYRVAKIWEQAQPETLAEFTPDVPVRTVAVHADGTAAAIVLDNNTIQIWSPLTGSKGAAIAGGDSPIRAVAFNPDATNIVSGSDDGKLKIWSVADGVLQAEAATTQPVVALTVRSTGPEVLASHADHIVRRWAWPMAVVAEPAKPFAEFSGHTGLVGQLQVVGTGNELLSGSADGTVRLWNLENGQALFNQNLGGPVTAISASADGQRLAAAGDNGLARVWNREGKPLCEVKGDLRLDRIVANLTDDQTVAKSRVNLAEQGRLEAEKDLKERDESLKKAKELLAMADKELAESQARLDAAQATATEAAKALEAKADDEALKKAKEEADKKLQEATGERDKKKEAQASAMRGVGISEQSLTLAKASLDSRVQRKSAEDVAAKQVEDQLTAAKEAAGKGITPLRGIVLSTDGLVLTTAGDNGLVQSWNSTTGTALDAYEAKNSGVKSLSAMGNVLVFLGGSGHIVSLDVSPRWNLVRVIGGKPDDSLDVSGSPFADRVLSLAFNPNGTLLAAGGGEPSRSGELLLFAAATGELIRTFSDAHSDTVFDLEFSRDGRQLVTGSADKFVKLFDVETGMAIRSYEGHTSHVLGVAIQADGSSLASAGADNAIKVWNTETGEQRRTITSHSKQVTDVEFVGVSENLVSASGDFTVRMHKASNGQNYRTFSGSKDYMYRVTAFGDESVVIAAGEDGEVRLWNGKDGNPQMTFAPPAPVEAAAQ